MLNRKFEKECGRGLSEENLRFIAEKIFENTNLQNFNNEMISFSRFCRDPFGFCTVSQRKFTFWDWFYEIVKVTRTHLRKFWVNNSIIGFIRKEQAEQMLSYSKSGTFILRFSDSVLGAIAIADVENSNENQNLFNHFQPSNSKDLDNRSLADRIMDLKRLTHLYPDIPKDQRFSRIKQSNSEKSNKDFNGYTFVSLVASAEE